MQPAIRDGSIVFVNAWAYLFKKPRIGDVVVFHYGHELWCKRVVAAGKKENYFVQGDNLADSREVPTISGKQIIGKIFSLNWRI